MVVTKPEFEKAMKEINEFATDVFKRLEGIEERLEKLEKPAKDAVGTKTTTKAK